MAYIPKSFPCKCKGAIRQHACRPERKKEAPQLCWVGALHCVVYKRPSSHLGLHKESFKKALKGRLLLCPGCLQKIFLKCEASTKWDHEGTLKSRNLGLGNGEMESEWVYQEVYMIRKEQPIKEVASENKDLTFNTAEDRGTAWGRKKDYDWSDGWGKWSLQ